MSESHAVDDLFLAFQQAVAGRYFIDREIGRGGMGIVYLAREVQLDRMVAIKLLPPHLAFRAELRARFVEEARTAARLSHPNIVPIHAVDEVGGFVFFVMALVDGVTLAERVRTRGPVSASDGARLLREVAYALEYAHGQGVVHRDVKPDNILLDRVTGRAMVADFGIAAVAGAASTQGGAGTPAFMSPEQALGHATDARSDIYSFGVTAYFALSGRLPFEATTTAEMVSRHVHDAPAPLLTLGLAIPRRLAHVVDRCLAKSPADRPESALAVAEQLGVALEQKREVPAVLRAFVKRTGRTSDGRSVAVFAALGMASVPVAIGFGSNAAFQALIAGTIASQVAFLIAAARDVLEQGFDRTDLRTAFASALDAEREERDLSSDASYRRIARFFGGIGRVAVTFLAVAAPLTLYALKMNRGAATAELVIPLLGTAAVIAVWGYGIGAAIGRLRDDVDTRFWARLWNGRIGAAAFALARRFRRGAPVVSAVTHRATELSLGMAAEQLYESLPRASRRTLKELPALLQRLQRDAQALRARAEALTEAVASDAVTGTPTSSNSNAHASAGASHAAGAARDAVRAERDEVQSRLRDAVGALETIRLNLLRLHAGQATEQTLTTQIGVARALSDDVQRLIDAREEAAAVLEYPRAIQPTPV